MGPYIPLRYGNTERTYTSATQSSQMRAMLDKHTHEHESRWMGHPNQYRFPSICYVPKMSDQNCQESTRKICFSGVQLGCRRRCCCRVQPVQPSGREEAVRRCRAGRRPRRTARGRRGQRAPLLQSRKTRLLLSYPGTTSDIQHSKISTLNLQGLNSIGY